jgi:hypothetical protein
VILSSEVDAGFMYRYLGKLGHCSWEPRASPSGSWDIVLGNLGLRPRFPRNVPASLGSGYINPASTSEEGITSKKQIYLPVSERYQTDSDSAGFEDIRWWQ